MKDAIGKLLDELIIWIKNNYKRPRLWIVFGIMAFCVILLFPYIDSNFFYFSRMEKRIHILESAMDLDETKIYSNDVYRNEYQSILREIEQQSERSIPSVVNSISMYINNMIMAGKESGNRGIKFLAGSFWSIIVTLWIPFMNTFKGRGDKLLAFILMLIVSSVIGWFFSTIPIIVTPMVNYVGVPLIQIIILIFCVSKDKKK